ncbi:TPA: hypothetical protein N0F65_002618 [Lagenidium giganteum]|uniref:Uncharacterized protein n=1 Tax=Lagenidium giganteum TaxID=4803 RepID=A0AAV2YZV0_9STRA|nr:TPA: hypothetical protein N0F65_002618 [Lagenidium giganteum]
MSRSIFWAMVPRPAIDADVDEAAIFGVKPRLFAIARASSLTQFCASVQARSCAAFRTTWALCSRSQRFLDKVSARLFFIRLLPIWLHRRTCWARYCTRTLARRTTTVLVGGCIHPKSLCLTPHTCFHITDHEQSSQSWKASTTMVVMCICHWPRVRRLSSSFAWANCMHACESYRCHHVTVVSNCVTTPSSSGATTSRVDAVHSSCSIPRRRSNCHYGAAWAPTTALQTTEVRNHYLHKPRRITIKPHGIPTTPHSSHRRRAARVASE